MTALHPPIAKPNDRAARLLAGLHRLAELAEELTARYLEELDRLDGDPDLEPSLGAQYATPLGSFVTDASFLFVNDDREEVCEDEGCNDFDNEESDHGGTPYDEDTMDHVVGTEQGRAHYGSSQHEQGI